MGADRTLRSPPGTGIKGGIMVPMAVFLVIKAHVSCNFRFDTNRRPWQASTGGARSRTFRQTPPATPLANRRPVRYTSGREQRSA